MTISILLMLAGIGCTWLGSELFVKGSVSLARNLRVPVGLIGLTVAAFATSGPELAVSITAAASGVPEISLGDVTGSVVVNIAFVLAIALLIAPLNMGKASAPLRDVATATAVS